MREGLPVRLESPAPLCQKRSEQSLISESRPTVGTEQGVIFARLQECEGMWKPGTEEQSSAECGLLTPLLCPRVPA